MKISDCEKEVAEMIVSMNRGGLDVKFAKKLAKAIKESDEGEISGKKELFLAGIETMIAISRMRKDLEKPTEKESKAAKNLEKMIKDLDAEERETLFLKVLAKEYKLAVKYVEEHRTIVRKSADWFRRF